MNNPLLMKFNTPFETVPFNSIKNEHFLPAIEEAILMGKKDIQKITESTERASFANVCEALDRAGKDVGTISGIFFNLHSAESSDELQSLAKELSPMLTEYSNDIALNSELFKKVKEVYDERMQLNLTAEEMSLVTKQYKSFARNGALLNEEDKEKLRTIDKELAFLSLQFGDNVLAETNKFKMVLENEEDLNGLPEGAKEAAAAIAEEKGHKGKWVITLDYPSYIPFMMYAEKRELREKLYMAASTKSFKGDELDNQKKIVAIAALRYKRARLLGYDDHAHFVLEERMAATPRKVEEFLNSLLDHARPAGEREITELREYAKEHGLNDEMMPWDYAFWSEKLKREKFNIDDEILRPYFKLENVVKGIFDVAFKLYGLRFKERKDIQVYHPDVRAFEVVDQNNLHVGIFYADFFPRQGKRSGAWMTLFREQCRESDMDIRPHVANVCNFTRPSESRPSLLTFSEVITLFHEFGHGLHGLLSKCSYKSLSGPSVYWDFVELPSQIMENWAFEKECLDLFAVHHETGEKIPEELIQKIKESSNFHEGRNTLRQLSLALLDMAWHVSDPSGVTCVEEFEKEAMKRCEVLPRIDGTNISCSFSHIFQGGYSAGYYSYKWAEVLDADAFLAFKEKGIFDKTVADKFRTHILEKGGSENPMNLYKAFRGKSPTADALLKRAGLID